MATLGGKRIHLVVTDSRGAGLGDLVRESKELKEHFEVKICRGASLGELADETTSHLQRCPFDVVYIAGGVCDITSKNQLSNKISYDWINGEDLSKHLKGSLNKADEKMKKYFPASKVVFCTLLGSELKRVVNAHPTNDKQQEDVNKAVWDFNCEVFRINKERDTFSPSLHSQVHRVCKGKKRNYYQHLHDGIHPSKFILEKWADQFVKAVAHN